MTDVLEINTTEQLRPYHLAWNALHAQTPNASFFQTLDWLECYWRAFGEGKRLRVLIVRHDGRPIGILPLVEQTESSRLGPVRMLTYPLDDWGAWYGPIGPNQTATLTIAMRHLANTPREWNQFEPRWMAHETTDRGRTERAMRLAGLPASTQVHTGASIIECDRHDSWEDYLASRTPKTRHEIRRQRRQLMRNHWVEHLRRRPEPASDGGGEPCWEVYNACVDIARRSWQSTSTSRATLCNRRVEAFLRDAHQRASRLGMVEMNLLTIDGVPAAYYYAYRCNGVVQGLRTGYDRSIGSGAGSVLIGRVIEGCFNSGDRRIDLGPGDEAYKARLRTTTEASTRLTHTPSTAWRTRALDVARRIGHGLRRAAG